MKKRINKLEKQKPWGKYERFTLNERSTVKILTIKPRQKISLQYHDKRAEFWKILDNTAKITVGKKTFRAGKNDEIFIPPKTIHRIEAYSKPVRVLEIALGTFNEKDITRVEDAYGRA
jgi:mannose-1-phosphate guanylyltransferase/mannose-1-phosphate guanylyltransferase/mannose-6-phosphate isomerase